MSRREFPAKVKEAAWDRCNGLCEVKWCRAPIKPGRQRYDHLIPDGLGGEPTLQNCQVLCIPCHDDKTHKRDVPAIAKTKRIARRHKGIKKDRTIRTWRRFNGERVFASRER